MSDWGYLAPIAGISGFAPLCPFYPGPTYIVLAIKSTKSTVANSDISPYIRTGMAYYMGINRTYPHIPEVDL